MLQLGDHVHSASGRSLEIGRLIGVGTQGAVYEALSERGPVAVKWYHDDFATQEQRRILDNLVSRPVHDRRFLWPIDIVTSHGTDRFGYSMDLRPTEFVSFSAWMSRSVQLDFVRMATIGINLADAFLQLHAQGLCYRDLNFENVFFRPSTGDILICDTDNIGVEGLSTSSVRGTPYCMAPEVIRHEAEPSTATDRHSLALMLFFLLMLHHPLDGQAAASAWDADAMADAYGKHPIFVFDPLDDSNRPIAGVHDHVEVLWALMPDQIRALFVRAFTEGLVDPNNGRVLETEWRAALAAMRDLTAACGACGRLNLLREDGRRVTCWSCRTVVAEPIRLQIGKFTVAAAPGASLYPHHFLTDYDFSSRVGHVSAHPTMPGVIGLKNESTMNWSIRMPDGNDVGIAPEVTIRLVPGAVITAQIAHAPPATVIVTELSDGHPPASMSA